MKIDFKKELEQASRGMIMIHDPRLLIKLIIRMIVRKLRVNHAAMILYSKNKDEYVLDISRGKAGFRIPAGYARFGHSSPIIRLFRSSDTKHVTLPRNAILIEDINKLIWRESVIDNGNGKGVKELLHQVSEQMNSLNTVACVPAYYQDHLMAVLLLGDKNDESKYEQVELDFFSALASDAAMAIRNAQLFENLKDEAKRNKELFLQTITVLGSTIEAKDAYTQGHTERVTKLSLSIARQMNKNGSAQFSDIFFENLYISGMLHDIGKIGVPESILNKRGRLTDVEYDIMKMHTQKGVEIVKPLNLPKDCLDGILHHHERYDGEGYPQKLKGENIPITAAIIAVADAFDAMTSDRPYRQGLKVETALDEIEKQIRFQFNPLPAKAILELLK